MFIFSFLSFYSSGEGDDCPCHTKATSRPPAVPVTTGPVKITLAPGESKYICNCGLSKNYPFCDGSHRDEAVNTSGLKPSPLKNETEEPKDFYVCSCGHAGSFPLCNGTHKKVREVA